MSDDVYRSVRVKAAELDTSVSALVREHLEALAKRDEKSGSLLKLIGEFRESRKSGPHFSAAGRLSREEIHDRNALRRHERSAL